MDKSIRILAILTVALVGIFVLAGDISAAEVTVCPSGCNYTSIQEAISNASAGETINVLPGTYVEHIRLNQSKRLVGENKETTIIDASAPSQYSSVIINNSFISGFTIRSNPDLPGIYVKSNSTVVNNIVEGAIHYNGIEISGPSNNVSNNIVRNCAGGIIFDIYSENNWADGNQLTNIIGENIFSFWGQNILDNYNSKMRDLMKKPKNQNIGTDNTYNGKPIYYGIGLSNTVLSFEEELGALYLFDSDNLDITDLSIEGSMVYLINVSNSRLIESQFGSSEPNLYDSDTTSIITPTPPPTTLPPTTTPAPTTPPPTTMPPPEMPKMTVLANSIDYANAQGFFEFLGDIGINIIQANASEFNEYKDAGLIIILGGPDAPEGVGEIVQEILSEHEQNSIREGNQTKYVKIDPWGHKPEQKVIVLAGSDRYQTMQAHEENRAEVSSEAAGL